MIYLVAIALALIIACCIAGIEDDVRFGTARAIARRRRAMRLDLSRMRVGRK